MKTLKFWATPIGDFDTKSIIDRELSHFCRVNKGIKVELEVIPWLTAWSRIIDAFKRKVGVDALMIGTTWVKTLSYLGALRNLDGFSINKNKFIPAYIDVCTYNKSLWAVPWSCDAKLLYYRKDHLAKAGIEPSGLDTWDKFNEACAKLARLRPGGKRVSPLGFSIQKENVLAHDLADFIWPAGGDFISSDGKKPMLNDPLSRSGLKELLNLISSGYISESSLHMGFGDVAASFFCKGAYTFFISGPWINRVFLNPRVSTYIGHEAAKQIGIAIIPGSDHGRFNFCGGTTIALSSFCENQKEAGALIEFLAGAESQKRCCRNINAMPGRRDVDIALPLMGEYKDVYKEAVAKYGRHFPPHQLWGSIEQLIIHSMSDALNEYANKLDEGAFFRNVREINGEMEKLFTLFGDHS